MEQMMEPKLHQAVKIAFERGYRVSDDGILISPHGGILKVAKGEKKRYPTFSLTKVPNLATSGVFGITVHTFAAYCFYGEVVFEKSVVIRHLNSDTEDVSKSNIVLGTHSQNNLDKPRHKRIAAAQKARKSQGRRPKNALFADKDVLMIRERRRMGETFSLIAKDYGVTKECISQIVKGINYADVR